MGLKQVGKADEVLLGRVDAAAFVLGQTRRVFVERALVGALESGVAPAVGGRPEELVSPVVPAGRPRVSGAVRSPRPKGGGR